MKHCHKEQRGCLLISHDHKPPSSYMQPTDNSDPSPDAHDHFGPFPVPCLNYLSGHLYFNLIKTHKHPSMIRDPITSPTHQPPVSFRHCPNMIFDYLLHHSNQDFIFGWGPSLSSAFPVRLFLLRFKWSFGSLI
jgi:hypothetical protein